jgi:anti-anti-sigma factor
MTETNQGPIFSLSINNDVPIINIQAKFLDLTYSDPLTEIIIEAASSQKGIIIDFRTVTYIDSVIISTIVKYFIRQRNNGQRLILCNTDKHVDELLETTRLNKILDIAEDLKYAVEMAKKPLTAEEISMFSKEECLK